MNNLELECYEELVRERFERAEQFLLDGDEENAKEEFAKAWETMTEYGCTDETENDIEYLRENWYYILTKGVSYGELEGYSE